MKKVFLYVSVFFWSLISVAEAAWVHTQGQIELAYTYPTIDYILFKYKNSTSLNKYNCTSDFFAIRPTIDADNRQQILSVLLTAQATGRIANIAYEDTTCVAWTSGTSTFLDVVRVGVTSE